MAAATDDAVDSEVKALIVPGSSTSSEHILDAELNQESNRQFFTLQTQNVKFPITFEVAKVFRELPNPQVTTATTGTAMDPSQLSQLTDRRFSSLNRDLSPSCIGAHSLSKPHSPSKLQSKKHRYNPINDHYNKSPGK